MQPLALKNAFAECIAGVRSDLLFFSSFLKVTQMPGLNYRGFSPLFNSLQIKVIDTLHILFVLKIFYKDVRFVEKLY